MKHSIQNNRYVQDKGNMKKISDRSVRHLTNTTENFLPPSFHCSSATLRGRLTNSWALVEILRWNLCM